MNETNPDSERSTKSASALATRPTQAQPRPADGARSANGSGASGSDWQSLALRTDFNPLQAVPPECRVAVSRLWMCNAHLLPSCLALAATVRVYLDEQPISTDDVNAICARLLQPYIRARHRFASDLMAELSRMVDEVVRRNESREAAAERERERKAFEAAGSTQLFNMPD